jgi:hypothetical protein
MNLCLPFLLAQDCKTLIANESDNGCLQAETGNNNLCTALESDLAVYLQDNLGVLFFPVAAPQVPFPFVVYERLDTDRHPGLTNDGYDGTASARLQFSVWSSEFSTVVEISNLIRFALDEDFNEQVGGSFVFVFDLDEDQDTYYQPQHGQDTGYYSREMQIVVKHIEPVYA